MIVTGLALAVSLSLPATGLTAPAGARPGRLSFAPEPLNGAGNNRAHPSWGEAGAMYRRLTPPRYADGIGSMVAGPEPRYVSNRIFNSVGVDLLSARYISQWGWVWGQFLDHTIGLAKTGSDPAPIRFDAADPLESFRDDSGQIAFSRDAVAPGTGLSRTDPRRQVNTVNSYLDAASVYGETRRRLDWLLQGPDNGRLADSGPNLLLPGGYLPRADSRGRAHPAPYMQAQGMLQTQPQHAVVAGDVRANDNAELTAVQTLFAREHNRIASELPRSLPAGLRFQIARRVVVAPSSSTSPTPSSSPRWAFHWLATAVMTNGLTPSCRANSQASATGPTAWSTARSTSRSGCTSTVGQAWPGWSRWESPWPALEMGWT